MYISLIVANSKNGVIGKDGKMPWSIPQDLKRFRKLTKNSIVIMGRKTFEAIGRPLDHRYNFVISKTRIEKDNIYWFDSLDGAIMYADKEISSKDVFIIGGASIYNECLEKDIIDTIYQTVIKEEIQGDTMFTFDETKWKKVEESEVILLNNGTPIEGLYLTWNKKQNLVRR